MLCFAASIMTIALFAWPYLRGLNDDMPLSWTIWPQTFRAIGGIFLVYWAAGRMPGGFAIRAHSGFISTRSASCGAARRKEVID